MFEIKIGYSHERDVKEICNFSILTATLYCIIAFNGNVCMFQCLGRTKWSLIGTNPVCIGGSHIGLKFTGLPRCLKPHPFCSPNTRDIRCDGQPPVMLQGDKFHGKAEWKDRKVSFWWFLLYYKLHLKFESSSDTLQTRPVATTWNSPQGGSVGLQITLGTQPLKFVATRWQWGIIDAALRRCPGAYSRWWMFYISVWWQQLMFVSH